MGELLKTEQLTAVYTLPTINLDIKGITDTIEVLLKQYSNWVVTENDIEPAKDTVAQLNKVAKSISDVRIKLAKIIKAPIDEMETILKQQTKIVEDLSKSIKTYLDEYERNRRAELIEHYTTLKDENGETYWKDYMIFQDRWLNKTTKEIVVINEMKNQRSQHDRDRDTIDKFLQGKNLPSERYYDMQDNKYALSDILDRISEDYELSSKLQPQSEKVVTSENTRVYTVTCEEHTHELIKEFLKEMNVEWN